MTIICRYIFLRFWLETPFASTKFCDLNAEMVQGRQILMFYTTIVHIANDCGYKILHFWANPQEYQTLVPAKNSHLKVAFTFVMRHFQRIWLLGSLQEAIFVAMCACLRACAP